MTILSPSVLSAGPSHFEDGQAAGSISAADMRDIIDSAFALVIGRALSASATAAVADRGTVVEMTITGPSTGTLTLPTNAAAAFAIGSVVGLRQIGTGQVLFGTAGTPTLRTSTGTLGTIAQWATIFAHKRGTDEWVISGERA